MGLGLTSKRTAVWAFTILCWFIFTPLLCHPLYRFLKYRQTMTVYSRGVTSVVVLNIFGIVTCLISAPFYCWFVAEIIPPTKGVDIFRNVLLWVGIFGSSCALLWRIWHMRYIVEEAYHRQKQSWIYVIDESQKRENDWYLSNKLTWGNPFYTAKYIAAYGCTAFTIQISAVILRIYGIVSLTISGGLAFVWLPLYVVIVIRLWCKTSAFHDTIYLRDEMIYTAIAYLCGLGVYFVFTIVMVIIGASTFTFNYVVSWAIIAGVVPICLVSTVLIVWKTEHRLKRVTDRLAKKMRRKQDTASTNNITSTSDTITGRLPILLSNKAGFQSFMTFLLTELSAECLFSVLEFIQFKTALRKAFHIQNLPAADATQSFSEFVSFAPNMPQSSIVADITTYQKAINAEKLQINRDDVAAPTDLPSPELITTSDIEVSVGPADDGMVPMGSETPVSEQSNLGVSFDVLPMVSNDTSKKDTESSVSSRVDTNCNTDFPKVTKLVVPQSSPGLLPVPMAKNSPVADSKEDDIDFQVELTVTGSRRDLCMHICKRAARRLFIKYIEVGSIYQINIVARRREKMIALMRDENEWKANDDITEDSLYSVFDGCIDEMHFFLLYSFRRFVNTDAYKQWNLTQK